PRRERNGRARVARSLPNRRAAVCRAERLGRPVRPARAAHTLDARPREHGGPAPGDPGRDAPRRPVLLRQRAERSPRPLRAPRGVGRPLGTRDPASPPHRRDPRLGGLLPTPGTSPPGPRLRPAASRGAGRADPDLALELLDQVDPGRNDQTFDGEAYASLATGEGEDRLSLDQVEPSPADHREGPDVDEAQRPIDLPEPVDPLPPHRLEGVHREVT